MRALLGKQRETLQQARDELIQMQQLQTCASINAVFEYLLS